MSAAAPGPITGAAFFSRSWRGEGVVSTLTGRRLRRFTTEFLGAWSAAEQAYLLEETSAYEGGGSLRRSWHITAGRRGGLVGLEASQGGRMFIEDRAGGFNIRYDRLRFLPGPNVARLHLRVRRQNEDGVRASGWTSLFGLVPLLRTELTFTPLP